MPENDDEDLLAQYFDKLRTEKDLGGKYYVGRLADAVGDESPRGMILIQAARLHELLRAYVIAAADERSSARALFDENGKAENFSSCIYGAHAFGLLAEHFRIDLNLIRNIRNRAAHTFGPFRWGTDADPKVQGWFDSLKIPQMCGFYSRGVFAGVEDKRAAGLMFSAEAMARGLISLTSAMLTDQPFDRPVSRLVFWERERERLEGFADRVHARRASRARDGGEEPPGSV